MGNCRRRRRRRRHHPSIHPASSGTGKNSALELISSRSRIYNNMQTDTSRATEVQRNTIQIQHPTPHTPSLPPLLNSNPPSPVSREEKKTDGPTGNKANLAFLSRPYTWLARSRMRKPGNAILDAAIPKISTSREKEILFLVYSWD